MTLVVGFKCRDGFVIGADTEITYGPVNFQGRKLFDFHGSSARYDLVMGGAGDTNYIAMTAEKIRDAVNVMPNPTVQNIKQRIGDVILEVHEKNRRSHDSIHGQSEIHGAIEGILDPAYEIRTAGGGGMCSRTVS
jgi:predicted proteasome-type protease